MIVLFSDFGLSGPYLGQVRARIYADAPDVRVVDLFADAPAFNILASSYLLAAYAKDFPSGSVFVAVVDPGVGSDRPAIILKAKSHWFVGPGNGIFENVVRQYGEDQCLWWEIAPVLDAAPTFHGRDVFAPAAAAIASAQPDLDDSYVPIGCTRLATGPTRQPTWPGDLAEVVYVDVFGNAITGLRASTLAETSILRIGGRKLEKKRTFSDVYPGQAFWYNNSNGLVEIAVNQGRADVVLGATIGAVVEVSVG